MRKPIAVEAFLGQLGTIRIDLLSEPPPRPTTPEASASSYARSGPAKPWPKLRVRGEQHGRSITFMVWDDLIKDVCSPQH